LNFLDQLETTYIEPRKITSTEQDTFSSILLPPDFRKLTYSSEKNMSSRIPGFLIRHYIFSIFNWELKITVILVVRIRSRLMTIFTISQFISNLLLGEWTTRPEKVKGRKRKERTCRKSSSKPLQTGFDWEKV